MSAIRIRKENQVYSAKDNRAWAMFNFEEKAKRETKVMSDLSRLVQRHMGEELGPNHDSFGAGKTDGADDWSVLLPCAGYVSYTFVFVDCSLLRIIVTVCLLLDR